MRAFALNRLSQVWLKIHFCLLKLLQVFRLNALKILSTDNTKVKQGAQIHQPTAWPVPRTCAQPYHRGSASQLHSRF